MPFKKHLSLLNCDYGSKAYGEDAHVGGEKMTTTLISQLEGDLLKIVPMHRCKVIADSI